MINPFIGLFLGKIDLSNLVLKVGGATFKYGAFLNSIINFLIIAFVVFLLIKAINRLVKKQPVKAVPDQKQVLLEEIRDLLKDANQK
ncbi:putative large conductance mechanosensitive channel protein [Lentilactobacillus parafarraginis F0439]|uniref:Putative large conductance mechanosensitive channel protein n=1 Tax=Lentilactobacillus parafarraginis F0439 TaxID=797515 RepID=G9ZN84_9LACO|nr:putative large conductance mechanosensitive channel protein [Lentilactobacillus parafarraginis F0439]